MRSVSSLKKHEMTVCAVFSDVFRSDMACGVRKAMDSVRQ